MESVANRLADVLEEVGKKLIEIEPGEIENYITNHLFVLIGFMRGCIGEEATRDFLMSALSDPDSPAIRLKPKTLH